MLLPNLLLRKKQWQNQVFLFKRLFSSHISIFTDYEAALDYKSIPRLGIFSFIRSFMPGGEFQDLSFYDVALELRKRLGDIYVLPGMLGKSDIVMAFNTKDIETVYRSEGQWPHREIFNSVKYFREHVKREFFKDMIGLPVSQGEHWAKIRSAVNPVLMKPQNLTMYIKPLQEINHEFIKRIREIRDPKTLEVPDNFDNEINRLSFESVSLVALNRNLGLINKNRNNPDAERLIECNRLTFEFAYKLDVQPSIWRYIGTPTFYKSLEVQEEIFRITHNYIKETLKHVREKQKSDKEDEGVYSVLEKLLLIDEKLAVVTAMDMLVAGVDTTSVTLISILLCLAKNPEKQQKLRAEVFKVMPTKDTELNENNMKNLPYLRAVMKEGLRYYPNGAGSLRSLIQNVVLSGYQIPKGSTVASNYNCLLRDETFFSQADKFIPERWLRNEQNKKEKLDPFSYLPFGIGPRSCIGKRLAEMEMEVIVMELLRNFEIEFNYDASKPFKAGFINMPGIPMRFKFKDIQY